jgi:hypothetical protein
MAATKKVKIDINYPEFLASLKRMEKKDQTRVIDTFAKLSNMDWSQVERDNSLNWEKVSLKPIDGIDALYTIRITQKIRAVVTRQDDFMRFITVSSDHDGIYGKK